MPNDRLISKIPHAAADTVTAQVKTQNRRHHHANAQNNDAKTERPQRAVQERLELLRGGADIELGGHCVSQHLVGEPELRERDVRHDFVCVLESK